MKIIAFLGYSYLLAAQIFVGNTHGNWNEVSDFQNILKNTKENTLLFIEMIPLKKQYLIDNLPETLPELDLYIRDHWGWGYTGEKLHPYTNLILTARKRNLRVRGIDVDSLRGQRNNSWYFRRVSQDNVAWAKIIRTYGNQPYIIFAGNLHCKGFGRTLSKGLKDLLNISCYEIKEGRLKLVAGSGIEPPA